MRNIEIKCDGCGADLTYTGNSVDYYLTLTTGRPAPWFVREGLSGGAMTDMMISPPIKREHHFCDLGCLDHWRARELHKAASWRDWSEKWKEEHGTKHPNIFGGEGFSWSYPSAPEEVRKERDAAFDAAALEAFPLARPSR